MAKRPNRNISPALKAQLAQASAMMKQRRFSAALPALVTLRQQLPRDPQLLWMLGACNAELGRHAEAIEAYGAATKADPNHPDLRMSYAFALQRGGEYERALPELERVLYKRPNDFAAKRMRISVLMDLARWEKAENYVDQMRASPGFTALSAADRAIFAIAAARLAPDRRTPQDAIDELTPLAEKSSLTPAARVTINWHLGRLHEAAKQYDDAFQCYKRSKETSKPGWDPDEHASRVDRLIECWSAGCDIPFAERDGSGLIFILGMMRSGTSLTEQMLSQLDHIHPGGEMNAVSRQVAVVDPVPVGHFRPLPFTRANYTKSVIEKMSKEAWPYFENVSRTGMVTDKQPYNYYYVPLIARMFPGCTIVHCQRDPQDTCLSNYFQSFSRPHPHTHDLNWLGRYFTDYQRMMAAWHDLPDIKIIDMPYEKLVADPKAMLIPVLDRTGLEWDDSILDFHSSNRTVRTSSRDQVRRPLYRSSVKKHENYAAHLGPLRVGLGIEA
ncbi:MAG: sulfotransferase [Phycisphaerales bacterium]